MLTSPLVGMLQFLCIHRFLLASQTVSLENLVLSVIFPCNLLHIWPEFMMKRSIVRALTTADAAALVRAAGRAGGVYVPELPGAATAYLSGLLAEHLGCPLVVVLSGPRALDRFAADVGTLYPGLDAVYFPPWERLPGADGQPLAEVLGDRLEVLRRCLSSARPRVLLTCVQALMQKTMAPAELQSGRHRLDCHQAYDFQGILDRLQAGGYVFEAEVLVKGQAAHRGGIIDCWPPSEEWPVRLEFFGDTLDSLRRFDPENQRSIERLEGIDLLPAQEQAGEREPTATLMDYVAADTRWVWCDEDEIRVHGQQYEAAVAESAATAWTLTYKAMRAKVKLRCPGGPVVLGGRRPRGAVDWPIVCRPLAGLPSLERAGLGQDALEEARREWVDALGQWADAGHEVLIYFGTEGTRDRFVEWRVGDGEDARGRFTLRVGPLSEGFHYPDGRLLVVSEHDVYGHRREGRGRYDPHARRAGPKRLGGPRIAEWRDIQPGELVVHVEHGIGRYLGLYEIVTNGQRQEVLTVEYADKAKIYLPVSQAHLLSRYIGFGRQRPDLHALGGKRWTREKVAAERAVRDLAAHLLETQAARQTLAGRACAVDSPWQHEFEAAFPFEETEDQLSAIADVKRDMESARPMDRLICGDVGYGKTEVAMRAAFKAVMDGRQVAMLVPTTVLAQQHYESFRERMAAFPVRIEMLSRFRTRAEQRQVVEELNQGRIDIVIGTHRLVQPDVLFKNLGLVIVDEEQRFGVEHKEHLKSLRQLVDVLTMTATPIPRTLYMSLAGARDISTIQTPPQERLPVETIVTEHRDDLVRDAIRRELQREGQVFYLHNRVRTIEQTQRKLQALVPEARIAVGHGQMNEHALEAVMSGFVRGHYDVLLCTTIIESGVDIPNVNTIFIERADRFGLSDLYQLRGRVGRYKHKAYAYLLLPRHGQLFSAARDRVRAIRKYSGLGSGFKLALRDLEIRGAGNILGAEQSGHIAAVGFDLYCQFLKRTVAKMKGETPPPIIEVEIRLDFIDASPLHADEDEAAVIPPGYIDDEQLRVNVYRRLAGLTAVAELQALREELADRWGPVPPALDRLLRISSCRLCAHACGIREVEVRENKLMLKRNGEWIMPDKRFPRLTATGACEKLDEIEQLMRGC
jgi:transcription-repair coupling factor (superfamily II helicase)